jgi:RimJ/RimL family protein N-acetyltransferase
VSLRAEIRLNVGGVLVEPEWPAADVIETARLSLEPLRADHAAEMAPLLDDDALHRYIGGRPATRSELRDRYRRQSAGRSPDGQEGWLNWVVRHRASGTAVGIVQATLRRDGERLTAELAWVIASRYQRRGYAGEAAIGMAAWLGHQGVRRLVAHVHPEHQASMRVAERLGLAPTEVVVDGEVRWATQS